MSTLVQSVRPGLMFGPRPEKADTQEQESASDRRLRTLLGSLSSRNVIGFKQFRSRYLKQIDHVGDGLAQAGDLGDRVAALRRALRGDGIDDQAVVECFALVRELGERLLNKRLHDVQLYAGWIMLHRAVAEMQTGEGKTLAGTLPAIVAGLAGMPVHVISVNDYLVRRDADALQPLYAAFGLTVGVVEDQTDDNARAAAYACDIVYVSCKQVAFDYLKDLQKLGAERHGLAARLGPLVSQSESPTVMRGLCFAVVDEVDSVLVDEARVPLILAQESSTSGHGDQAVALGIARRLHEGVDFHLQPAAKRVWLTDDGLAQIASIAERLTGVWRFERYRQELVRQALAAQHLYLLNRDYLVREREVLLIDSSTGRVLSGRKLQNGLHQMIEVKERCELSGSQDVLAAISYQSFFRRYHNLTGMSGTCREVAAELREVYGVKVVAVPTRVPSQRQDLPAQFAVDQAAHQERLVNAIREIHGSGQPVLVGTRTVEQSESLSRALEDNDLKHSVLNARQDAEEAEIVARAGHRGAITVATNMAGRGTDIPIGRDVDLLGGLAVINACVNDSGRVDRQLKGRCGRQGNRGAYIPIYCLEDELVGFFYGGRVLQFVGGAVRAAPLIGTRWANALIKGAQRRFERRHRAERMRVFRNRQALRRFLSFGGAME